MDLCFWLHSSILEALARFQNTGHIDILRDLLGLVSCSQPVDTSLHSCFQDHLLACSDGRHSVDYGLEAVSRILHALY